MTELRRQTTLAGVIYEFLSDHAATGGLPKDQRLEMTFDLTNYIFHRIVGSEKWVEEKNKEDVL